MAQLSASIAGAMDYLHKTPLQAVTWAGLKIAESGRSIMSKAKAWRSANPKRDIEPNPEYKQALVAYRWARRQKKRGKAIPAEAERALSQLRDAPFAILLRTQRKTIKLPSYDKQDPRRIIYKIGQRDPRGKPGRGGVGRTSWNVIAGKMGAAGAGADSGGAGRFVFVSTQSAQDEVRTRILNKLSYQEKAYPGMTQEAIRRGTAAIERVVQKRVAEALSKNKLN